MITIDGFHISLHDFFLQELMHNSTEAYLLALFIAVGGMLAVFVVRRFVLVRLKRWTCLHTNASVINLEIAESVTKSLFVFLPLLPIYWGLRSLTFSSGLTHSIGVSFLVLFTLALVRLLANLFCLALDALLRHKNEGHSAQVGIGALLPIIRMVTWALGLTFLLDNLGFQVSSIVTGLGIMGVAVGLAGQAILGDFFSYLVILLDKPFDIGNVITVNGVTGTVEHIGIKTTRLRSFTGEMLVYPNSSLTTQQVGVGDQDSAHSRTQVFKFGVAYETPQTVLETIPGIVGDVAKTIPGLTLDRIHMVGFGDSSLNFEASVTFNSSELSSLLEAQQKLFFGCMRHFVGAGIQFAYPVRRIRNDTSKEN